MREIKLIGFGKVRPETLSLDQQKKLLEKAGCKQIVVDDSNENNLPHTKPTKTPKLEEILESLTKKHVIVVTSLNVLASSARNLGNIIQVIKQKGCDLKAISENIDTREDDKNLIFKTFEAITQFEENKIQARTQKGLRAAKAMGKQGGRPKALDDEKQDLAKKLYQDRKHSIAKICEILEISKPTLYKYVEDIRNTAPRNINLSKSDHTDTYSK